jgi:hypothetical protein
MANKIIHDLTAVAAVDAADEFEVQKSGETTTKKATLTQVTQVEATARTAADNAICAGAGLAIGGACPSLSDSWYLRDADLLAGWTDRSGVTSGHLPELIHFIQMLDARVYALTGSQDQSMSHSTFKSPAGANGIFHCFGFYEAPAAHKAFTQAAATQTLGTAANAYGAYVFVVPSGPGAVSGGSSGTAKITITGLSITDAGVCGADSETLVPDVTSVTGCAVNTYIQSTKKWVGQVTLTIAPTFNRDNYNLTCNYGYAAPHVFNNSNVIIDTFVATGRGGDTDASFNIQLLEHNGTGWIYSAAAFQPGGTVVCALATDCPTAHTLTNAKRFKYKRKGLALTVNGAVTGGIVVRITTSTNNAVESSDFRLYFSYI